MKQSSIKLTGKKVLIVDDYVMNLDVLIAMLKRMDCVVDFAKDGETAVEMHKKNGYDLILMDLVMPKLTGEEATEKIRQLKEPLNKVTIIAITACNTPAEREVAFKAGIDDYLTKPIRLKELEEKLKQYF